MAPKSSMKSNKEHRKAFYHSFTYNIASSSKGGRNEGETSMTDSHIKYNINSIAESLVKLSLPMLTTDDA